MKACRSLNATRYLQICRRIHKHLMKTTTMWLHRVCWDGDSAWESGISTNHDVGRHESVHEAWNRKYAQLDDIQIAKWLRMATRNLFPEDTDTDITVTSPIFSDSLRGRSETSLLASLNGPSPRAGQVLPAYTEPVSPNAFTNTSRSRRNNKHIIE